MSDLIEIKIFDEDIEEKFQLPAKFEVCSDCGGHGTHLCEGMRGHAYSSEEFDEEFSDEEDREAYFNRGGKYDVTCSTCGGKRVVLEIDREACCSAEQKEILAKFDAQEKELAMLRAQERAERRAEQWC